MQTIKFLADNIKENLEFGNNFLYATKSMIYERKNW